MLDNYFIIDCNALCYWCLPHSEPNAELDKVVIFNFLLKIKHWCAFANDKNHFVFCWDSKIRFREEVYPEYKANRNNKELLINGTDFMPNLNKQMVQLRTEILPALGFTNIIYQEGFEADDLIAFCVHKYWLKGDINIVSRDHDLYQLFEYDFISFLWGKESFTKQDFIKMYGIEPEYFTLMKAIAGDAGDNIPGIPGVGKKKAVAYLLEKLPQHHKAYKDIEEGQAIIDRNLELVTLPFITKNHRLKPFSINLKEVLYQKDFYDVFEKLNFTGLLTSSEFKTWQDKFHLI